MAIVSTPFADLNRTQITASQAASVRLAVVPHPFGYLAPDEIRALTRSLMPQILEGLLRRDTELG